MGLISLRARKSYTGPASSPGPAVPHGTDLGSRTAVPHGTDLGSRTAVPHGPVLAPDRSSTGAAHCCGRELLGRPGTPDRPFPSRLSSAQCLLRRNRLSSEIRTEI